MEKTMNYIDAMDFLEETKKYGSQLGLTSIQNLMAELGNIQDKIPLVHIGGTNGKGSVGAMLSQVLTEAGYRVGRFCTPDVFVYEDEFQMNGINIEKGRLAQLFTRVKAAFDGIAGCRIWLKFDFYYENEASCRDARRSLPSFHIVFIALVPTRAKTRETRSFA